MECLVKISESYKVLMVNNNGSECAYVLNEDYKGKWESQKLK